jgi:hypothetical protein
MQIAKNYHLAPSGETTNYQFQFFCKLFSDMIIGDLCHLRRSMFNDQKRLSCSGCSKDTILNSPHNIARRAVPGK